MKLRFYLLIAVLILIGWLAQWLYWPSSQARAQDAIEGLGGAVLVDDEHGYVRCVVLYPGLSDEGLEKYTALDELLPHEIEAPDCKLTDQGLKWLTRLDGLETLMMRRAAISDEGLAHLAAFKKLKVLVLDSCPITDRGLEYFKALPQLRKLSLLGTPITAAGVQELQAACPNLTIRSSFRPAAN